MSILPEMYLLKEGKNELRIGSYHGLHFTGFTMQSPQPITNYKSRTSQDGEYQNGDIIFGPRTVTAGFYFETQGDYDFESACREIWKVMFSRKVMRIRDNREPALVMYVYAKAFDITRVSYYDMTFSVEFDMPSGFRESIVLSDELGKQDGAAQMDMNLPTDTALSYVGTTGNFKIYNASDVDVEPYNKRHQLDITIQCAGAPVLTNKTTGDVFQLSTGTMKAGDKLVIHNGVQYSLNDQPIEKSTNHGTINLTVGWNEFTVTGCSDFQITFSFPFIYF